MNSKFFRKNIKKLSIIASLSVMMIAGNANKDIEAEVYKDLTMYSGGGGAGADLGLSYFNSLQGQNGLKFTQFGDEYTFHLVGSLPLPGNITNTWNYISGSPSINKYVGQYDLTIMPYDVNHYYGGGVDGYTGTQMPSIVTQKPYKTNELLESGNYTPEGVLNVDNLRLVAGDGGNPIDPIITQSETFGNLTQYFKPISSDGTHQYSGPFGPGANGSDLTGSFNHINLEGDSNIISGNDGILKGKSYIIDFPGSEYNGGIIVANGGSKGGAVNLIVSRLVLQNNNTLNFEKKGGKINANISNLEVKSNGLLTFKGFNMKDVMSNITIRNYDFWGGTIRLDQYSNSIVDLSGSTIIVNSRDLNSDNQYDLIHSDDFLTGSINLDYTTDRLIEYRLISDTETITLPKTTSSLDLSSYQNIHTIQAIFGYEATFESNGGSTVPKQVTVRENDFVLEPSIPTLSDHHFIGWYLDANLNSKYNFNTPVTSDIKLYAKWQNNLQSVNLHFKSNAGSSVNSQSLDFNTAGIKPTDPVYPGHQFEGWYLEPSFDTLFDFNTLITQDTTVYAKWSSVVAPLQNINLNFNSNGGSTVTSQSLEVNTSGIKPTDPVYARHRFEGWYLEPSLDTLFDFNTSITQDTTVYAKWSAVVVPLQNVNLNFNSNGGSVVTSQSLEINTSGIRPTDPIYSGHQFEGWYLEPSLNTLFDFNTLINQDTTVYAKWTPNPIPDYNSNVMTDSAVDILPETGVSQLGFAGNIFILLGVGSLIIRDLKRKTFK